MATPEMQERPGSGASTSLLPPVSKWEVWGLVCSPIWDIWTRYYDYNTTENTSNSGNSEWGTDQEKLLGGDGI